MAGTSQKYLIQNAFIWLLGLNAPGSAPGTAGVVLHCQNNLTYNPRRLRRNNEAGGSAHKPPLGLRPIPRWGTAPNPSGAPPKPRSRGDLVVGAPAGGLGAQANLQSCGEPGVWGGAPTAAAPLTPPLATPLR